MEAKAPSKGDKFSVKMIQFQQKHVPVQSICPVCGNGSETTYHALVGCQFARQCWRTTNVDVPSNEELEFPAWFEKELRTRNGDKGAEIIMLCWAVWRVRNDVVWNKKTSVVIA